MSALQLPALAGNGAGTAINVSALAAAKTVVVSGSWQFAPTIQIEVNCSPTQDGGWAPVGEQLQGAGTIAVNVACYWMRVKMSNFISGVAPSVWVGAGVDAPTFLDLTVPVVDGTGAASSIAAAPPFKTVQVSGPFGGVVNIEISQDGSNWSQVLSFQSGEAGVQNATFVANYLRVKRSGVPALDPGTPSVAFAASQLPGVPNATLVADATEFAPDRVLFVAKAWPTGVDPNVYFTTVAAALTRAAVLVPTAASPVVIRVAPGTYTENVTMLPFVPLVGDTQGQAIIAGNATITPTGSGVEGFFLMNIRVNTGTVTITTTGKTGGTFTFNATNCNINAASVTGRSASGATQDLIYFGLCNLSSGSFTFSNCLVEIQSCRHRGCTFNNACIYNINGGNPVPNGTGLPWAVNGTSTGIATGSDFNSQWTFASGTSGTFAGCHTSANINANAGSSVDVLASDIPVANLVGPGPINRRTHIQSSGATSAGANAIAFTIPFIDANYNVNLQLTAGPGNAAATITAKAGSGFTINDSVGGNTFDITVAHN